MVSEEHKQIISKALELERRLRDGRSEYQNAAASKARKESEAPPAPPILKTIPAPQDPTITPTVKFNWKLAFLPAIISWSVVTWVTAIFPLFFSLAMLTVPWIGVYTYWFYWKRRRKEIEKIRASEEYQAQCRALREEHQRQQEAENEIYEKAMEDYNTNVLAPFEKAKHEAIEGMEQELGRLEQKIAALERELQRLYDDSGLIPEDYRSVDALSYVDGLIASGYWELDEAFAQYAAYRAEKEEEERLRELELEAQADELFDSIRRGVRTAAGVAAGAAVVHHVVSSQRKKAQKAPKQREYKYTCSLSCPYRGKGYGPTKCKRDPATCGNGMWYTWHEK